MILIHVCWCIQVLLSICLYCVLIGCSGWSTTIIFLPQRHMRLWHILFLSREQVFRELMLSQTLIRSLNVLPLQHIVALIWHDLWLILSLEHGWLASVLIVIVLLVDIAEVLSVITIEGGSIAMLSRVSSHVHRLVWISELCWTVILVYGSAWFLLLVSLSQASDSSDLVFLVPILWCFRHASSGRFAPCDLFLIIHLLYLPFLFARVRIPSVHYCIRMHGYLGLLHWYLLLLIYHCTPDWLVIIIELILQCCFRLHSKLTLVYSFFILMELLSGSLKLSPIHAGLLQVFDSIL